MVTESSTEDTSGIPQFLATILSHRLIPAPNVIPTTPSISAKSSPNPNFSTNTNTTIPPPNPLYLPPPALPKIEEDLVPPENFSLVSKGVYRSGFPKKRNFGFMQTLRLKTVLTLVLEDYPEANLEWCQSQDIQFMQFGIPGNKEPFDNIPEDVICSALVAILDVRNHPILIHCNKGKHRTGCLIGCIRRLQSWSLTSIFDEYRRFSSPKSRAVDQQFIDLFDLLPVWNQLNTKGGGLSNLPGWDMLVIPSKRKFIQNKDEQTEKEKEKEKKLDLGLRLDQQLDRLIPQNQSEDGGIPDGDGNAIGDGNGTEEGIDQENQRNNKIISNNNSDKFKKLDGDLPQLTTKIEEVTIN